MDPAGLPVNCPPASTSIDWLFDKAFPSLVVLVIIFAVSFLYQKDKNENDSNEGAIYKRFSSASNFVFGRLYKIPLLVLILGSLLLLISSAIHDHGSHALFPSSETASGFAKEFGFALIIAYFVSIGIERIARERHNKEVREQLDAIKENVFSAVYKINHDKSLVDFVDKWIYKYKFTKEEYRINIIIEYKDDKKPRNYVPKPDDILTVLVKMRAIVKNNFSESEKYDIISFVEQPYINENEAPSKLTGIRIDGNPLTLDEIQQADSNKENTKDYTWYRHTIDIPSNGFAEIIMEYEFTKLARDEFSWRSREATNGIYLNVTAPPGLRIQAAPMHVKDDIVPEGSGTNNLSLDLEGPSFPHNGVLVWWVPAVSMPCHAPVPVGEMSVESAPVEGAPSEPVEPSARP
jgi:hypothetical protein